MGNMPVPAGHVPFDIVEVRFKNSRKDFFRMTPDMELNVGDIVAVETSPGHDIGIVSLTGETVRLQLRNRGISPSSEEIRKVYRRARISDVEKWISAVELEHSTMHKTREIAVNLGLSMKVNDVEYQGDHTKAIFYYTAEDRVDFRELIKVLAEEFKVRIEMRQIGARQEASRLGGIGSCGRELCCCTWLSHFHSVTTQAARIQQLSLNPQKLAGQCGKLKCCLNYEYETYMDALKDFPETDTVLKTKKGDAFHQKTDIFSRRMWYSYAGDTSHQMAIPVDQVLQVIEQNRKGILPENLEDLSHSTEQKTDFENGQEEAGYFDHPS
jgi:cell fate regulator YaaT (PSP1 superfamily)